MRRPHGCFYSPFDSGRKYYLVRSRPCVHFKFNYIVSKILNEFDGSMKHSVNATKSYILFEYVLCFEMTWYFEQKTMKRVWNIILKSLYGFYYYFKFGKINSHIVIKPRSWQIIWRLHFIWNKYISYERRRRMSPFWVFFFVDYYY